jgi:hypothetical protein
MSDYELSLEEMVTILEKTIDTLFECHIERGDEEKARERAISETLNFIRTKSRSRIQAESGETSPEPDGQAIFIVEFRQHIAGHLDQANRFAYAPVIAHIASSLEKATEWCKANAQYEDHDPHRLWDFAVRKRRVDGDLKGGGLLLIVDWDGEVSGWKI